MTKILDRGVESTVCEDVLELLAERGYSVEESIPGLISSIIDLAETLPNSDQALDEAADLLSDVGVDSNGLDPSSDDEVVEGEIEEVDEYGTVTTGAV